MLILGEFWVLSLCKRVNRAHFRWINAFIVVFRRRRGSFIFTLFIHSISIFLRRLRLSQLLSDYLTSFIGVKITSIIVMICLFTWLATRSQQWIPLSFRVLVLAVGIVVGGAWVLLLLLVIDNWVRKCAVGWGATARCRFICDIDWLV